jgi:ABC-type glycerol-3-phosphate transport system substrate-binding protein
MQSRRIRRDNNVRSDSLLSRRDVLRLSAAGAAAAGVGTFLSRAGVVAQSINPGGAPIPSGVTITADYMASGTYDMAAKSLVPEFLDSTGNEVEIVTAAWADLNQKNVTDLVTGTGEYDVMSGEWWIVDGFPYMLPIDDYVARDNFGGDYIPNLFQAGPSNFYQGKRLSVPFSADCITIIYNTELFEQAGVDPTWTDWTNFMTVMESLKGKLPEGVYPHVFQFGAPEQPGSLFLAAYDGYLVASDTTYKVDPAKATAALDIVKQLVQYGPPNALALSIDEATAVFLQGNAAALLSWPSFVRTVADDPNQSGVVGKWAVGSLPGPGFPLLSCWNHFISSLSENPDVAWEWIKAYSNVQKGTDFMVEYGVGSPYLATYQDPVAQDHAYDWPQCAENLTHAKPVPYSNDVWAILYNNIGDFLTGAATADEVIERWHSQWERYEVPVSLLESAQQQGLVQAT